MPSTTTEAKTAEERIHALEQQVDQLAEFVGRLTFGAFGGNFKSYDVGDDQLLVWHEELCDEGTEDEALVGWWVYKGPEYQALIAELDAKNSREAGVDA